MMHQAIDGTADGYGIQAKEGELVPFGAFDEAFTSRRALSQRWSLRVCRGTLALWEYVCTLDVPLCTWGLISVVRAASQISSTMQ